MSALRFGVLGAARIAPMALIEPARANAEVEVTALAARDPQRARRFAARHGLTSVHESYEALLSDPNVDAVYNPLPNGLHGQWTIAALEAGKHVLCEKPFTANAEEAEAVAAVARSSGKVVMEAFHYRYHALTARMLDIIASGELGNVRHISTWMCIPLFMNDIRWNFALAGGSLMDTGCYTIHLLRTLAGAEPKVRTARVKLRAPNVDRFTEVEFDFADGRTGKIVTAMASTRLLSMGARVTGSAGEMRVSNPIAPQFFHQLEVRTGGGRRKEQVAKQPSSYAAQLQAFTDAVLRGKAFPTHIDDSIANMRVIDACYAAAGLPRREPSRR
ncbi:MAG: Gfo/Idh/MocA family oxidoreductase [Hyphomonadaceae bacterium]|nr:Gfo/Idh/MocA family oxidoreductase [Hyphomonadaceae bacterium]